MNRDLHPINILLIEDNPGDALLVEEYLIEAFEKAKLTHVTTFSEAKDLLQSEEYFDEILLDLSLPDSDGIDLIKKILEVAGSVPVIVLTGYSNLEFSRESLSMGVLDYLLKDELSSTLLYKSIVYSIERNSFSEKLKKSEKNYRHLFEFSPVPMWVYDLNTLEFLDVNKAAIRHYGFTKAEFLNMTIRDIRPPDSIEYLDEAMQSVRSQPNKSNISIPRHQKKNGEIIQVEVEGSYIDYKDREARLVLAEDVTAKLEEEQRLKQLESVITNTTESVVILEANPGEDHGRRILYVNGAFTDMTQYSRDEVMGRSLQFLNGPDTDPKEIKRLREKMKNWDNCNVEFINYRKDGTPFWINTSMIPITDKNGDYKQWAAIGRDISKQKAYEKQLEDSLEEKEVLLSEIHHRVKNNLAVVSSLMQLQAFNAHDAALEEKLYDSVFRISSMATIHELLYQSRSFSKLNFSEIINKLIYNIDNVLKDKKEISTHIDKDHVQLNINQAIPCSLLINEVITNSYKHAFVGRDCGKLSIKLRCVNDEIKLKISDNGIGLPEKLETDEENEESLGLHLIQVLTSQLNGKSGFRSSGEGTTFTLSFKKMEQSGTGSAHVM